MDKKRFVVYFSKSNNVHHYFESYDEAKKYIVINEMQGAYIAKLLAYSDKPKLVELKDCE